MTAVEVFESYAPTHRKPWWSRVMVESRDKLLEFGNFDHQPRHRAEVSR